MPQLLDHFTFLYPLWFLLLLPLCVILFKLWRHQSGSWENLIPTKFQSYLILPTTQTKGKSPVIYLSLFWVLATIALAGPSIKSNNKILEQNTHALIILLNLSPSMLAQDLVPSRLARAKYKIQDLLQLRPDGLTGLIAFADTSHIVTPLSTDQDTLTTLLPDLHPEMMPIAGRNTLAAMQQGLQLIVNAGLKQGSLLLLTDNISQAEAIKIKQLLKLSSLQIKLAILGIGTINGAPIPTNKGHFMREKDGELLIAQLPNQQLQSLAESVSGHYHSLTADDQDIQYLLATKKQLLNTIASNQEVTHWYELGPWLILFSIPLGILLFRRGLVIVMILCTITWFGVPNTSQAGLWQDLWQTKNQQGLQALQQGDSEQASALFTDPLWQGISHYRNGDYQAAVAAFEQDNSIISWYNKGNALAHLHQYEAAIDAYDQVLTQQPKHQAALANKKMLQDLLQQQDTKHPQSSPDTNAKSPQQQTNQNQQQAAPSETSKNLNQAEPTTTEASQAINTQQASQEKNQNPNTDPQQESQSITQQQAQQNQQQDSSLPKDKQPNSTNSSQNAHTALNSTPSNSTSPQKQQQQEKQQEMELWLQRIPQNPGGLLKNKFYLQAQQQTR